MSQPIQSVEGLLPLSGPPQALDTSLSVDSSRFQRPLRMLASLALVPVLLVIAVVGFVIVIADFSLFRLNDLRQGHPRPKGLWEF